MKVRELNMKPSFSSEVMGFPSADMKMLWEKIDKLVKDPFPDGKLKKKLKELLGPGLNRGDQPQKKVLTATSC